LNNNPVKLCIMKQSKWAIGFLLVSVMFAGAVRAQKFESIEIINKTNWAKYFNELIGYPYDSHGCLHFYPNDSYLLYETIPKGIPFKINKYSLEEEKYPAYIDELPYLIDIIETIKDLKKHQLMFKNYKTELVAYPSLNLLVILVNKVPYAKVHALAGLPYDYLMPFDVRKGEPIQWDFMLSTPTDPGDYTILKLTDHYISNAYYKNTVVPFGAWMKPIKGVWSFQEKGQWHKLPSYIVSDLKRPAEKRFYNYYEVNVRNGKVIAARYAGHDFGRHVMLWTTDGRNHYPEMGYAAGVLVFEQIVLVKDLVDLLTMPGSDDFETCVSNNKNFSSFKGLYKFKESKGKFIPKEVNPALLSYYKLYNGIKLNNNDRQQMDERVVRAFKEFKENRLPRNKQSRWKSLGLYNYARVNSLVIDKQAYWYEKIKNDWDLFKKIRIKLREDFDRMGILSLANRQNTVENWLKNRMIFNEISPPKQAKYLSDLSFSTFFKPNEESRLFTQRERDIMLEKIKKEVSGQGNELNLKVVDALNNYNFGILLNEILGDLYKSHGCMHVSPRNMVFLYQLLPVGAEMKVRKYSERIDEGVASKVPFLADLVDFEGDLDKLKEKFLVTSEVRVEVFPYSGNWVIYLKEEPFARLRVRGGPQSKFYLLQGRTEDGKPIFEEHLAYSTTPGDYRIFKKVQNYISQIYYDTTIIPMEGTIKRQENKWIFQDKEGNWKDITKAVLADLNQPPEGRKYTYYDTVKDAEGNVVEMKWGSHPFGRYSLQSTKDGKTAWPELIHSSGDLIMEERQLVSDLIKVLTAPHDELDKCIKYSQNFDLYKVCYDFINDPTREDLIQVKERASYKLYHGMGLPPQEVSALPQDILIANKVLRNEKLSGDETKLLISERIASSRRGKLTIDMQKILGLQFDTYQYVVTIQKYAHHYETLKKNWDELSGIRKALLADFNTFVLKDPKLFNSFMRELMLKRNRLEKLSQRNALQMLNEMLGEEEQVISAKEESGYAGYRN
jgi:hypothetical protein